MSDFTDPEFEQRLNDVCGLYVDPPEHMLMVSIDEKTGIKGQSAGPARHATAAEQAVPTRTRVHAPDPLP